MAEFDFIVDNGNVWPNDKQNLFGSLTVENLSSNVDMLDVLVKVGVFPSKGQARKNWRGPITIPLGFSQFTVGKLKHLITIWNPDKWENNNG